MIRLSQGTLARGTKTLLEDADVALNPGDKIGLIGPNGSGKSSLFALMRGELHADPALYGDAQKDALKALILDQAYVARELAELEAEWLALQEQLETSNS